MLQIRNLSKSFGGRDLFRNVTFSLSPREKMGLVGRNGMGKSTLLKIIAGEITEDGGDVSIPKGLEVGFLKQQNTFAGKTVLEETLSVLPKEERLDYKAEKLLLGLGLESEFFQKSPLELSGGQQMRICLAKLLLKSPQLLLLDEPTNYLDVVSIRWLARFLKNYPGEIILVSHDRSFMNQVATSTGGIFQKEFRKISGPTNKYYDLLAEQREHLSKTRDNQLKKIKQLQEFADKYRAKARKASQAQSKLKAIEKMDVVDLDPAEEDIQFSFQYAPVPGKTLLEIKKLSFGYQPDLPLFQNLTSTIKPGDIIGIVGKNGKGKSTLLNVINKSLSPQTGEIKGHPKLKISHFAQTNIKQLVETNSIIQEISLANPELSQTAVRQICGAMLFSGDDAFKNVKVLSGGERSRVLLGKIIATQCNVILLDEPSAHLDMESIEVLCREMKAFPGAVLIVSHDEDILRKVCNKLIIFRRDSAEEFLGSYDDFIRKFGFEEEERDAPDLDSLDLNTDDGETTQVQSSSREERKALKRDLKKISTQIKDSEGQIEKLETRKKEVESLLSSLDPTQQASELNELTDEWSEIENKIEHLFMELEPLYEQQIAIQEKL